MTYWTIVQINFLRCFGSTLRIWNHDFIVDFRQQVSLGSEKVSHYFRPIETIINQNQSVSATNGVGGGDIVWRVCGVLL